MMNIDITYVNFGLFLKKLNIKKIEFFVYARKLNKAIKYHFENSDFFCFFTPLRLLRSSF